MTAPFAQAMAERGHWADLRTIPPRQFQVLGERASGTNVVRRLLELNTPLKSTSGLGWKHGFPHMVAIPTECLVVCAVRAPGPWALSMHKRPWHAAPALQALGFSDFIRAEWQSVMDRRGHFEMLARDIAPKGEPLQLDRHPITGAAFPNLFALRSAKLAGLAGLANRGCSLVMVQMEWATGAPDTFLDWIAEITGTTRTGPLQTPGRRMGNRFTRAVPAPETPEDMSAADRAFMSDVLDADMEAAFGYPSG